MPEFTGEPGNLVKLPPSGVLMLARPESLGPAPPDCEDRISDVVGLIDTGAHYCSIRLSLAERLGLVKIDEKRIGDASTKSDRPVFLVDVIVEHWRRTYEAIGCPFPDQDLEFVIGRNFLADGSLHYDGRVGRFRFEFD